MFGAIDSLSGILSIAGTMQPVKNVGDQMGIVEQTAHWFVLGRTRSAFERLNFFLYHLGATFGNYM